MQDFSRRTFLRVGAASILGTAVLPTLIGCSREETKSGEGGRPLSFQAPWVNDAEFLGYFIAMSNGYYEAERIRFEYKSGGPELVAGEVLAARGCDIALTNIDGTIEAIVNQNAPFKIIGAQYQKSPLGIVTLQENGIRAPADLARRRLAVPAANRATVEAFLRLNNVDPGDVRMVPYQYDPTILIQGQVDATVDFVTNVPYTVRLRGKTPHSFLFYDHGFKQYMDAVVVRTETLASKRAELVSFLRASRRGWVENFRDVNHYPQTLASMMSERTGRTIDNEKYFNVQQKPLIESPQGIFSMTEQGIEENIASLRAVGLRADRSMFVTDLLAEL
jgi:ABC-type nitrate/sulfonate/bicarbonate transport system substrate-binding protein